VGHGVPELVGMQPRDAHREAAPAQHPPDAAGGQRPPVLLRQPQLGPVDLPLLGAGPQIAAEREPGLLPEGQGVRTPPLADHMGDVLGEVEVGDGQPGDLRQPPAGVQQQPDDRRVPAVNERGALRRCQQRAELRLSEHRHRLLRNDRRPHPLHRRAVDLLLVQQPPHQLLQGPLHDVGRRRRPGVDQVRHVGLDVPASQLRRRRQLAVSLEELHDPSAARR